MDEIGQLLARLFGRGAPQVPTAPMTPPIAPPAVAGPPATQPAVLPQPQVQPQPEPEMSYGRRLLSNLQDPNFRQAMFQTGTALMKTPGYGQGRWDVAGNALSTGANTLYTLREQQRQQAEAAKQREFDNRLKTGEAERQGRTAGAYVEATGAQTAEAKQRTEQAKDTFDYNKGRRDTVAELADALSGAETDLRRGQANKANAEAGYLRAGKPGGRGGGGVRTPQDIQKIEMMSLKYQADGLSKIDADDKAVRTLELQNSAKTPGEMARALYADRLRAWSDDINNLGKPLDPAIMRSMLQDSIDIALELNKLDVASQGSVPGAQTSLPGGGILLDPTVQRKIEALKAKNTPPQAIREGLIGSGVDPKLYGY